MLAPAMAVFDTLIPPLSKNCSGEPRRVGVEIELSKVSVKQICDAVESVFGGTTHFDSEYTAKVETKWGEFDVLVDAKWALKLAGPADDSKDEAAEPLANRFLKSVADWVVPLEIATPPLAVAAFSDLDALADELARVGARGTHDSVFNAFGVHFNPELPSFEPELIVRYLQSFIVLRDWLLQTIDVDLSRRATPFIDRFPTEYARLVLDASYEPTQQDLIEDYLRHNPTRNRALDMLPLFAHLDERRVRDALPDEKINARPTFHYRMANSRVGEEGWTITSEWRPWLEVEKLTVDRGALRALADEYRELLAKPLDTWFTDWGEKVGARIEVERG